ncbi:unnamed protein product [Peronospora belbahrii]|uniref:Uncharacterized protein n=1 Tax=Peronospora belbahrii TaxID=622444 RepID=A0AAU9KSZ6_9STRA|nr:unnamed protein product [Peronospora belbahrii]CAH0521430.1 unnamed protein product [Peronospora belbahrii]
MIRSRAPASVRELVDQPLKKLGKLYENSLKAMMVCGLEFYLSASLVASFFQCPDETVQAEQELQTLYTLAWVPLFLSIILVYGPKLSVSIFPSPEHFERNMLRCKIFTWLYAFGLLIWDPDMIIKTGPSLGVSILFCIADVGRFIMDMKHLTEVEYDDNGNSFIIHKKTPRQSEQPQDQQQQLRAHEELQEESYTVQVIGVNRCTQSRRTGQHKQQSFVPHHEMSEVSPSHCQEPLVPLYDSANKLGSRRQSRNGTKRDQDLRLDQFSSSNKSEDVAVLDSNGAEKEDGELIAKKSFTYEF